MVLFNDVLLIVFDFFNSRKWLLIHFRFSKNANTEKWSLNNNIITFERCR